MGLTDFNFEYLKVKFGIKNRKELREKLLSKIIGLNFKELAKDVMPFLINPDDKERVASFKEYLEQKLR